MDLNHFGLRARPFRTSPDVDAYYPATTHEAALALLRSGLENEEGILLLQGDPGTGKTLIAHLLLERMLARTRTVFLTHGSFSRRIDLLQGMLFDLDLPYQGMTEQELRLALTESCLNDFRQNGRTVIVVDEAHLLPAELFEELRLLSNLEGKEGKAVQLALIGLPSIAQRIEQPGLEAFRQRVKACGKLEPMNVEESADYLLHQIRRAGGRPEQLLGEDVLDILCHASRGIPRLLNQAAHCAFTLAQVAGSAVVDAEAAVEAVTQLGLDEAAAAPHRVEEDRPPAPPMLAREREPLPPIPVVPAPTVSIELARSNGLPTYVYGGVQAPVENSFPQKRAG